MFYAPIESYSEEAYSETLFKLFFTIYTQNRCFNLLISTVDIENGETKVAALKRLQWKVAGQQNRVSAYIYYKGFIF